jgi:lipoprotein-anchoring transpeptidase ErfK/SrfK
LYTEPPRKRSGGLYWLLSLLLLGGIGAVWWRYSYPNSGIGTAPQTNLNQQVASQLFKTNLAKLTNSAGIAATSLEATNRVGFSETVLVAQIGLDRLGISPGSLDGVSGGQTRAAIRAFQKQQNLPVTGEMDLDTAAKLATSAPPKIGYIVSSNDLARLQPVSQTWLGKSQQSVLDFETVLELVAEKSHSHPNLIRRLNPEISWTNVAAGAVVKVPNAERPAPHARAAVIRISLENKTLEAFDAATNLLVHFPCSIAAHVEKRPVGTLRVADVAVNPNYTFDPKNFPESAEARELGHILILPPGPNSPVGAAWIGLDRPGYGIHGTPVPENVGRTESHGCFRLANWNAEYLARMVVPGALVIVEP